MKNLFLLGLIMLTMTACNETIRYPLNGAFVSLTNNDSGLTVVDNLKKGTKGLELNGKKILASHYTNFIALSYGYNSAKFIAVSDTSATLYEVDWMSDKVILTARYSAASVMLHDLYDSWDASPIIIGTRKDGRKEVYQMYNRSGNHIEGPYDDIKLTQSGYLFNEDGLWGIHFYGSDRNNGNISGRYKKIYVISFCKTRYCTYAGNGQYDVNIMYHRGSPREGEEYFLHKIGTTTQETIDTLMNYSDKIYSDWSFVTEFSEDVVPQPFFDKAEKELKSGNHRYF